MCEWFFKRDDFIFNTLYTLLLSLLYTFRCTVFVYSLCRWLFCRQNMINGYKRAPRGKAVSGFGLFFFSSLSFSLSPSVSEWIGMFTFRSAPRLVAVLPPPLQASLLGRTHRLEKINHVIIIYIYNITLYRCWFCLFVRGMGLYITYNIACIYICTRMCV